MSQQIVLEAQQWLNSTYGSDSRYSKVNETGNPGSATSEALVSAMQIALGLSNVTGYFGSMTSAACDASPLDIGSTGNRVKILQYGFYCKGYDAKATDGVFSEDTKNALIWIQQDAGLSDSQISSTARGLQLQAVLGIDEYKQVSRGDSRIRLMQQELNRTYLDYTGLRPCDGIYSRGTNEALIYALQAEEHLPIGVANGNFGPTTMRCCPDIPSSQPQTDYYGNAYDNSGIIQFTKLVQFILYCIGHNSYSALPTDSSKYDSGAFNGEFNQATKDVLHKFQTDVALSIRDQIGIDEWMAMLVSTGNPNRPASACDCVSRLTKETANSLYEAGYRAVGRYLTGDMIDKSSRIAKNLLRPEMNIIFESGLKLFVIFQDVRQYYAENPHDDNIFNYFNESRGCADAEKAFSVAKSLGVPKNEIIYFAVDYDFVEEQVDSRVIPYFKGVNDYAKKAGNTYQIGIYGSRNTCTLVKNAGYSISSFVADLSTGYSGNMGFPLPDDWAFDQINEIKDSESEFGISLDRDVKSGSYEGFGNFEKQFDDEWDLISQNGCVSVVTSGPDNKQIPVYWAKIKNDDGSFSAKYPMYDGIEVGAFFSWRRQNPDRTESSKDSITYVYFRDVGGRVNAGYIDWEIIDSSNTEKFSEESFVSIQVIRNKERTNIQTYQIPILNERTEIPFLVTQDLVVYTQDYSTGIVTNHVVTAGTEVKVLSSSQSGATYPTAIRALEYTNPSGEWLYFMEPNEGVAYLDLGFEIGATFKDRSLITSYN